MAGGKKILIACSMIEDELNEIIRRHRLDDIEIVWMERGHHDHPEKLNEVIRQAISDAEKKDPECILLAYGLCGNGAIGWKAATTRLVMPRFDDCVNMMLCPAVRSERNLLEMGKMYMTKGWIAEKGSVGSMLEEYQERYGERKGFKAMKLMLESYHHFSVIDTGCYELGPVQAYAKFYAELLGFEVETVKGSIRPMEKLLTGEWDEDIIVKEPGEEISEADFVIK